MLKPLIKVVLYSLPAALGRRLAYGLRRARVIGPQHEVYLSLGRPDQVLSGPFAGMKYSAAAVCSAWLPKLIGTYECELHPVFARVANGRFDQIVDVGSAEGYYAVGLTLALKPKRTWAFDIDPTAERLVRHLAQANRVDDVVEVQGFCDLPRLQNLLHEAERPLVVCDCEGYEAQLLDPAQVPALHKASIIVETHDERRNGPIATSLRSRFEKTHRIEVIEPAPRSMADVPAEVAKIVGHSEHVVEAIAEHRKLVTDWFFMSPFNNVASAH